MVITPVRYESWPHVWRIKARLKERPGVVRQLLAVLRGAEVNVLCEESTCVDNGQVHSVELIVDVQGIRIHPRAGRRERDPIEVLHNRIQACCFADLLLEDGALQVSLEPLQRFRAAYHAHKSGRPGDEMTPPRERISVQEHGTLRIPDDMLASIRASVGASTLSATLASDTRDRLLHVFFPRKGQLLIYARISHLDRVGALATITELIADQFNIVTSFTRIHSQGGRNHLEVLLSPAATGSTPTTLVTWKRRLENALRQGNAAPFALKIAYPKSATTTADDWKDLTPKRGPFNGAKERGILDPANSTDVILAGHRHDLEMQLERPSNPRAREEAETRLDILNRLQRAEGAKVKNPRVFVSYVFEKEEYFLKLEEQAGEHAFELRTGKDPWQEYQFRDELIRRINTADGFLGIWTGEGDRINSWLLWELGVAQAFRVPFRLLISARLSGPIWKDVIPDKHNFVFKGLDFAKRAGEAFNALRLDIDRDNR